MENSTFKVGQKVAYSHGSYSLTGEIVKIKAKTIIIINSSAGMELYRAGYAVGDEISFNHQVKIIE
jgi:hypothetical protein